MLTLVPLVHYPLVNDRGNCPNLIALSVSNNTIGDENEFRHNWLWLLGS